MKDGRKTDLLYFNLNKYFWDMLEGWRVGLVIALLLAIITSAVRYGQDLSAYKHATEAMTEKELREQEKLETLKLIGKDEEQQITTALTYYAQWKDKEEYFNNSFLMNSDPTEEKRLVLRYYVKAKEEGKADLSSIVYMYTTIGAKEDFLSSVSKYFGINRDNKYFKELFSFSSINDAEQDTQSGASIFIVSILLPNNVDTEAIEKAVTEYVKDIKPEYSKKMGDFDVELVSSYVMTNTNRTRADTQMDDYKRLVTVKTQFQDAYKALNDEKKDIVDSVIESGNVRTVLQEFRNNGVMLDFSSDDNNAENVEGSQTLDQTLEELEEEEDPVPGVQPMYAVLGFAAGIILFAAFWFLRTICSSRITDESAVEALSGVRSFGAVYQYPYTGTLAKFVHDRSVYERRHKKAGKQDEAVHSIVSSIAAKAEHLGLSKVEMLVLGSTNRWSEGILKKQETDLRSQGIEVSVVTAEDGLASLDEKEFNTRDAVCLVVLSGISRLGMVNEFLTRADEYERPVIGTEFLEGN